ncbi:MAG: glycosyltransferase family 2 protein [Desulfobacterales bacterium]|jgi:glycosyltransferase involved in cell wall biosynthesis|nr:glycosyltransferase family 2 protein [Desulfobacterales bacterium]
MVNIKLPISVLILTLNEEDNLPVCLAALSWCDDIVVLDSGSTDHTCIIAEKFGARIYSREFDTFASQRNYGLEKTDLKHEWVLHLDADEVMTGDLLHEIKSKIQEERFDAYRIPCKMIFWGKWLRYSGMYPTYQVRLTRNRGFRFRQVGHGQKEDMDLERVGTLENPYLHYSFSKGIGEWFDKHNRYAGQEADETIRQIRYGNVDWKSLISRDAYKRRMALKQFSYRLPFRPFFRFAYMYFLKMGFLDGIAGFHYCCMVAIYEYMIVLKVKEKRQEQSKADLTSGGCPKK